MEYKRFQNKKNEIEKECNKILKDIHFKIEKTKKIYTNLKKIDETKELMLETSKRIDYCYKLLDELKQECDKLEEKKNEYKKINKKEIVEIDETNKTIEDIKKMLDMLKNI